MQDAGTDFDTAVTTHRTWMPPRVRTDWAGTGYSGDRTIDDLSPQVGDSWDVGHTLDDGYPNTVAFVSGTAAPEMTTELGGRAVNGVWVNGSAYWSPLRTDSPVYGQDRDIAPVTHDMGLVTASGPQYVRVFTGQMTSTPVKDGKVQLKALSATRLALMQAVQPPAFDVSRAATITASWVVSWCLYTCGLYAGPAPRAGATVAYFPMHGGTWRFHDGGFTGGNDTTTSGETWHVLENTPATNPGDFTTELDWIDGPYVAAPDLQLTAALSRRAYTTLIKLGTVGSPEADMVSQAGAAARLEAWIKGDAADVNNAPGGSGTVSRLFGFQLTTTAASNPYVQLGVDTTRHVYAKVFDGTNTRTLTSTGTLATDGGWYFIGAAYDAVVDKLWVNLNGTVESSSPGTINQAGFPATDSWYSTDGSPFLLSYLPFSDVTLTSGAQANVDSYPLWRNDSSFAPTARVGRSVNTLAAVVEQAPREAWQIITEYAQAELAMSRCDELDVFEYLPPGWWVRDAQQELQDTISTQHNAAPFDIDYDPSRIRTAVKVTYTDAQIPQWTAELGTYRRVFELSATSSGTADVSIPPGSSTLRFVFQQPVAYLYTAAIDTSSGSAASVNANLPTASYVTLNAMPDGTGTEYTSRVTITVTQWDAGGVTIAFVNSNPARLYFANNDSAPVMVLTGIPVTETSTYVQEGDSGGTRGERLLEVSAPAIQTSVSARRLARNLLANLRHPMATVGDDSTGITVTADPRRQPGDLVTLDDTETGVTGGLWRLQSVRHHAQDAQYTQELVVRQVYPICIVGQGIVGQSLVGPSS